MQSRSSEIAVPLLKCATDTWEGWALHAAPTGRVALGSGGTRMHASHLSFLTRFLSLFQPHSITLAAASSSPAPPQPSRTRSRPHAGLQPCVTHRVANHVARGRGISPVPPAGPPAGSVAAVVMTLAPATSLLPHLRPLPRASLHVQTPDEAEAEPGNAPFSRRTPRATAACRGSLSPAWCAWPGLHLWLRPVP